MKKEVLYHYLGTNGTILSPVHLEDVYYTKMWKLTADNGKSLTKDGEHFVQSQIVPDDEVSLWEEV